MSELASGLASTVRPRSRDIALARRMIVDAIGELVPVAQAHGVRLGVEALPQCKV